MSKTKQPMTAQTFAIGDRVLVSNGSTGGASVSGTVIEASKGWYNVELDDPEACDGREQVSARAGSMLPYTVGVGGTTAPADPPYGLTDTEEAADDPSAEGDEPDEDEAQTEAQRMSAALKAARARYAKTKRPNGAASASCNDQIAKCLQDLEPMEVAYMADKVLAVADGTHLTKYGNLNNGQIRMNSGNRIRATWKKAVEAQDLDNMTRIGQLLGFIGLDETAEGLYGVQSKAEA